MLCLLMMLLQDVDWSISLMGAIYFCFVITIGAFVFVNLVVAVVVTNLVRTSPNTWAGRGGGGGGGAAPLN